MSTQQYEPKKVFCYPCYQCDKKVNYLFEDGRCKDCTRFTAEEVTGAATETKFVEPGTGEVETLECWESFGFCREDLVEVRWSVQQGCWVEV